MSDWLVVRIPFNKPSQPEIVEVLADIPLDWKKYLLQIANKTKRAGRYLVANILYNVGEAFYPKSAEKEYKQMEKKSGD